MISTRKLKIEIKDTNRFKVKGCKKIYYGNINHNKSWNGHTNIRQNRLLKQQQNVTRDKGGF